MAPAPSPTGSRVSTSPGPARPTPKRRRRRTRAARPGHGVDAGGEALDVVERLPPRARHRAGDWHWRGGDLRVLGVGVSWLAMGSGHADGRPDCRGHSLLGTAVTAGE